MQLLKEKVGNILIHVKGQFGQTFIPLVDEICTGYNLFLYQYVSTIVLGASSSDRSVSLPMEDVYKQFYESYHQTNEASFIDFFEFVMVKSYSEAICESIGSIMNMACGTG